MIWAVGMGSRVQKRSKCSGVYADIHVKYTNKQNNSKNSTKNEDSTNNDNNTRLFCI